MLRSQRKTYQYEGNAGDGWLQTDVQSLCYTQSIEEDRKKTLFCAPWVSK